MTGRILFDLSRLLSRADRPAPTGIDRVELAYARWLIDNADDRLSFAALDTRFGPLPAPTAIRFVEALERAWRSGGEGGEDPRRLAGALKRHLLRYGEAALHAQLQKAREPTTYLLVSHHHLDRPALFERLKRRAGARVAVFVHDLIPMQFPEYTRPGQPERHRLRMETAARWSDAVIVNSQATKDVFGAFASALGASPRLLAAPLGVHHAARTPAKPGERPYFVALSTLEPKKNHLLLLHLWRELAARRGASAPRLVLVGQRGWMTGPVVELIERSTALKGLVEEHNALSDQAMERLLRGARALLFPSFAEGYGLPVAEALAHGVPVLCSDLKVLREVGGAVPEYLHPLDGMGWLKAVEDYAVVDGPRRLAQLERMKGWRAPAWSSHFAAVGGLLDDIRGGA